MFKSNQNAFNTGDLVSTDWYGYVYFIDRLGDTFRWKGENVSTVEVENALSKRLNSTEVIVYGVEIPGKEGRAGMATVTDLNADMKMLSESVVKDLPSYARPLFIRLSNNVEHTGSFKAQKSKLVEEGFNINLIKEKVYYLNVKESQYRVLDKSVYEMILQGKINF